MTSFNIMKKDFKDALAVSKRAISKKTGVIRLVGNGSELHFYSEGEFIKIYDYKPLLEETTPFAIEVDPKLVDKWLDKANREMEFQVVTETNIVRKKEVTTTVLTCIEKNLSETVVLLEDPVSLFKNARVLDYKPFKNPTKMIDVFSEVSKSFQKSDRLFADFAKFTDINTFVFDPLYFLVFLYQEELGILDAIGNEGIAIHKDALDVLVKTVKKPKSFSHMLVTKNQAFLIKEENTVFWMDYRTDVPFPNFLSIKTSPETKESFTINADDMNETLKNFPNAKTNKVIIESDEDFQLNVQTDSLDSEIFSLTSMINVTRSIFAITPLKSFFEGITGDVEIIRISFTSKTTQDGYFWMYRDGTKSKIMPGIKEAPGFQYSQEVLDRFKEQLSEEFDDHNAEVIPEEIH